MIFFCLIIQVKSVVYPIVAPYCPSFSLSRVSEANGLNRLLGIYAVYSGGGRSPDTVSGEKV